MKHIKPGTLRQNYGDKKDAANIKPGIKGVADRIAMLNRAKKEGRLKEDQELDERNKENADKRKAMDASRGSDFKAKGHPTPDPESKHKTDQAHDKSVGRAIRKMSREEVEQIDELSPSTLTSYRHKARNSELRNKEAARRDTEISQQARNPSVQAKSAAYAAKAQATADKRRAGQEKATSRLSKEEVEQTDEARIKGKGYDNPENERKAPEGKVPFTSFQQGKQGDQAARLHATSAKGKLVKGKAQSAPQKESYELTPEDIEFINSLNEKQ